MKSAKYDEVNSRMNRRTALEHLLEWKSASNTRIQQYKACRTLERLAQQFDVKKGFN